MTRNDSYRKFKEELLSQEILNLFKKKRRPLPTTKISVLLGANYYATLEILKKLNRAGVLTTFRERNGKYWELVK